MIYPTPQPPAFHTIFSFSGQLQGVMLGIELVLLQTNIKREYGSGRANLCQRLRASVPHQSPITSSPVLDYFFSIFASLTCPEFDETT